MTECTEDDGDATDRERQRAKRAVNPRVRPELHESTQWTSVSEGDGPNAVRATARRAQSIPPSPRLTDEF